MRRKKLKKSHLIFTIYVIISLLTITILFSVNSQKNQFTFLSKNNSSTGTISVVLEGRLIGMPGTKVNCKSIDGINTYDETKTVKNSGTTIPYYLTCFVYLPLPGQYKLTASPVLPGFQGSSEIVNLYGPEVKTVELKIRFGPKSININPTVFLNFFRLLNK
jgi:hypothetical protein